MSSATSSKGKASATAAPAAHQVPPPVAAILSNLQQAQAHYAQLTKDLEAVCNTVEAAGHQVMTEIPEIETDVAETMASLWGHKSAVAKLKTSVGTN